MNITQEKLAVAAKTVHESIRTFCLCVGETPNPPWEQAEEWQRTSTFDSLKQLIENNVGPRELHQTWCDEKVANGWRYGAEKDATLKTHPCLVPYDDLPIRQKRKDDLWLSAARGALEI